MSGDRIEQKQDMVNSFTVKYVDFKDYNFTTHSYIIEEDNETLHNTCLSGPAKLLFDLLIGLYLKPSLIDSWNLGHNKAGKIALTQTCSSICI